MQNLKINDLTDEEQTFTTEVRYGDKLASLIELACAVQCVDKDTFILMAIAKEAQRVLEKNCYHVLTLEDAKQFQEALDNPRPPTPRAIKAAAEHRRRVVNAD